MKGLIQLKNKVFAVAVASGILLSACGMNNDNNLNDTAVRAPDVNEPTRVNYNNRDYNGDRHEPNIDHNIHTRNVVNKNNNDNNNDNNNNNNNNNNKMVVADKAADKVADMEEVKRANVIVTDNNAYVAATLQGGKNQELTKDIERKISDQIKSVDQDIEQVYVSVNPDFYNRVDTYANDIRNGKPVKGFFEEFNETVRRMFPNRE
ncbi:YhcN/YlaJ family sporulation lipoprotein [Cytobacillus purgationiresistens]|uniref:YhcN/YlaJ family sporulation lipoprotein n=1 Tax=Cytobacillus purgationiresistens TaxID=863449 RepID=A0ABU0ABJ7_9BACI|nr:YhcN/YlaJ family sporulation lipoprotein [Cytobacillus purgationiresistens]MDQ0268410.1 YhcN/YlaJ family sporulation lipoprotein [Cytobacillus purgationiresistens]